MGNGALAGAVLDERVDRSSGAPAHGHHSWTEATVPAAAPIRRPRLQQLCTIAGFDVCLLTRTRHDGVADPLAAEALALERATMRRLGDEAEVIAFDIAETIGSSTFVLLIGCPPDRPHRPELIGAVRLMLGDVDGIKTLWDVDRLSPRLRGPRHPWMGDPTQLVDALALSPAPDTGLGAAEISDLLMAACTCVGGALLHSGRARYLTGYVHERFHRHVTRIGYPMHRFVPDDHASNYEFAPVVASLEAIDHLVRVSPTGTHFGDLRGEYLRVVGAAASLGTADW
jgi:hypothetical protein